MMDENDQTDQTKSDGLKKMDVEQKVTCLLCEKHKTEEYWDAVGGVTKMIQIFDNAVHDLRIPMCKECVAKFELMSTWDLRKRLIYLFRFYMGEIKART